MITIKRVYEAVGPTDGTRLLIERLWPRGVKKTSLKIKSWIKDVAPSTELRQWFSHDPVKWDEFRRRYSAELKSPSRCVAADHRGCTTGDSNPDLQFA